MQADIAGFAATAGIAGSGQLIDFFADAARWGCRFLRAGCVFWRGIDGAALAAPVWMRPGAGPSWSRGRPIWPPPR